MKKGIKKTINRTKIKKKVDKVDIKDKKKPAFKRELAKADSYKHIYYDEVLNDEDEDESMDDVSYESDQAEISNSEHDMYYFLANRLYRFLMNCPDVYINIFTDHACLITKICKVTIHKVTNASGFTPYEKDNIVEVPMSFILYWGSYFTNFESKFGAEEIEIYRGLMHKIQYDKHQKVRIYEHTDLASFIKNLSY